MELASKSKGDYLYFVRQYSYLNANTDAEIAIPGFANGCYK